MGATLSAYKEFFNNYEHFIGIELITDCTPPKYYTLIDHHNEKSDLPSSIEQVANFIGITLDRFQMLVAENDKGYIPALIKTGATDEEIKLIRLLDRKCQGVTEEEERLADQAIKQIEEMGRIAFVRSFSHRFSPITDRLYGRYNHLVVYDDISWVYYGTLVRKLVGIYEKLISEKIAYFGGAYENGFFGVNRALQEDDKTLLRRLAND